MDYKWYKLIDADTPLTQGDIITDCPLLDWDSSSFSIDDGEKIEQLDGMVIATQGDVIVMTQACDLEQDKVEKVILCSHYPLDLHKEGWDKEMQRQSQNPTSRAWKYYCNEICKGSVFNISMLNRCTIGSESIDVRVVMFNEVFTLPRSFLERLNKERKKPRFSLLPPYWEHLSQAFARYFMRVGLPTNITPVW